MSLFTSRCECGSDVDIWFGDRYYGRIMTTLSSRCENCGACIEGDDGRLTGNLRAMHLQQEGTWAVQLTNLKDRIWVLKIMRELLGLSISDSKNIIKSNSNIFTIGTKAEAFYVQDMLKSYGVTAEIVRYQSNP